jgi:hypothetical protein
MRLSYFPTFGADSIIQLWANRADPQAATEGVSSPWSKKKGTETTTFKYLAIRNSPQSSSDGLKVLG